MRAIFFIFIAMAASLVAILLWFVVAYHKFKKQHGLTLLLLLLLPATASAQYIDGTCRIAFRWLSNQAGTLQCDVDGLALEFVPSSTQWEIKATNTTETDAVINWDRMQLIVSGIASKIDFGEASPQSTIGSHSQVSQTIRAYNIVDKKKQFFRIYDKRAVQKGRNVAVTIVVPISVGSQLQFFHTIDFIVTNKP